MKNRKERRAEKRLKKIKDTIKHIIGEFKAHPIQRTRKETIFSIWRKIFKNNKQKTEKGYVK